MAKKLLDLLLVSGISRSIWSDPGTEFTADVVQHLCRWLKLPIDFWPVEHAWAQEAVERLGGWIHETLTELCKPWPKRVDECVQPALWLQRTTPFRGASGQPHSFKLLFGRDLRSQINAVTPELDGSDFLQYGGLHNFVADHKESWREVTKVRAALLNRHKVRQQQRSLHNAGVQRASAGTKVKRDDLVMMQEADSTLWHEGVYRKLVHQKWTWKVSTIMTLGLCYHVVLNGRQVRERRAAASHIKPFYVRPSWLRHDFGDEYAHFAWDADLGLAASSTMAAPLYTLVDRQASAREGGAWRWEYKGRFLNETESG